MFELTSYVAVVQKAVVIENKSDMSQKGRDGKKRKIETSEGGNAGQGNHFQNSNQQRPNRPPIPDCQFCGRKHFGNCNANVTCFKCGRKGHFANVCQNPTQGQNLGTGCYKCGKPGHIVRNFPTQGTTSNTPRLTGAPSQNVPRIEEPPAKDQPKARTFNMTMKDVVQSSDVVVGKALMVELANKDQVSVDQVCPSEVVSTDIKGLQRMRNKASTDVSKASTDNIHQRMSASTDKASTANASTDKASTDKAING
ncbi:hypothetical protein AgCh_001414 [Apium graveolens]